jgi:hypothetical protein
MANNPLQTLQQDLDTLASPDASNYAAGTAHAQAPLTEAQAVLTLLAEQSVTGNTIAPLVAGVYTQIATVLTTDVVSALQGIAAAIGGLSDSVLGDATTGLTALQTALQTAQSLVPGGTSAAASALAATNQFATLLANLLSDVGSTTGAATNAADQLYAIAQQVQAIAAAFSAAGQQ